MHWRTYDRLTLSYLDAQAAILAEYLATLRRCPHPHARLAML
jgi:hypothetical protein